MRVDDAKQEQAVGEVEVCQLGKKVTQGCLNAVTGGIVEYDRNEQVPIKGVLPPGNAGHQELALVGWRALKQLGMALLKEVGARVIGAHGGAFLGHLFVRRWWSELVHWRGFVLRH